MLIFLWGLLAGCIELYEFEVKNDQPALVIEGQISNVSYNESKQYPADGRYFTVKLRLTNDVTNVRDEMVTGAYVSLISSEGDRWDYAEKGEIAGEYILCNDEFSATNDMRYKLEVLLSDGDSYESNWEQLPENVPGEMGDIKFEETELEKLVFRAGEKVIRSFKGIDVTVDLPATKSGSTIYYRWDFTPTWIYEAALISSLRNDYKCWIQDPYYLSQYVLQKDNAGSYAKKLFFLETISNSRIYGRFSVLITQIAASEEYFNYYKEMQDQGNRGGLFDAPPYNLKTNLNSGDPNKEVFGYFGVVDEQAKRWYFNRTDASYLVKNAWKDECTGNRLVQPARCYSCLQYESGVSTNIKPDWWVE